MYALNVQAIHALVPGLTGLGFRVQAEYLSPLTKVLSPKTSRLGFQMQALTLSPNSPPSRLYADMYVLIV
jgi:hypothetical protein